MRYLLGRAVMQARQQSTTVVLIVLDLSCESIDRRTTGGGKWVVALQHVFALSSALCLNTISLHVILDEVSDPMATCVSLVQGSTLI